MRLTGNPKVGNVKDWMGLRRFTSNFLELLPPILNGGIEFGKNIRSDGPLQFTITEANQVVPLAHTLGFIPMGYLLIYQTTNAVVFVADESTYPWTETTVYLTASAAVRARVILI